MSFTQSYLCTILICLSPIIFYTRNIIIIIR
nr:MAG TPA: hypothetical protein [Bacteriophage sp.]